MNKCQFCGKEWEPSEEEIKEMLDGLRASYPNEEHTEANAINLIEYCPVCVGSMTEEEWITN